MTTETFFQKFANTPIPERSIPHNVKTPDGYVYPMSLMQIYEQIELLEKRMRPDRIAEENLLKEAERIMGK